jgi:hypothetical protein
VGADDPFSWEHDVWVKHGWCPVIRRTKSWCNLRAGHGGSHMSPLFHPDQRITQEFWGDEDAAEVV